MIRDDLGEGGAHRVRQRAAAGDHRAPTGSGDEDGYRSADGVVTTKVVEKNIRTRREVDTRSACLPWNDDNRPTDLLAHCPSMTYLELLAPPLGAEDVELVTEPTKIHNRETKRARRYEALGGHDGPLRDVDVKGMRKDRCMPGAARRDSGEWDEQDDQRNPGDDSTTHVSHGLEHGAAPPRPCGWGGPPIGLESRFVVRQAHGPSHR